MFVEVIYEFLQENPFIKKNEPLQVWVQRLRNIWEASRPSFLLSLLQFPWSRSPKAARSPRRLFEVLSVDVSL